jgi:quercetin dioxygenase-like cupin family protein
MHRNGDRASEVDDPIRTFLVACAERLTHHATTAPATDGAAAFASAVERATPLPFEPSWLPALDTIREVDPTPLGRRFIEVAPLERIFDLGELTVGVMYVASGCCYPLHAHPPHELYLTLTGHGEWRYGGHDGFRAIAPDAVLYNHPGDLHSAVAGSTPLVALYVLWP